jgi:hypothetical protein
VIKKRLERLNSREMTAGMIANRNLLPGKVFGSFDF